MNQITEQELAQQSMDYWLARVTHEMPTPDNRTLTELGRAAWLLSQAQEACDDRR